MTDHVRAGCAGVPPLRGRLEPWMIEVARDPDRCADLLREHGSPLHLMDFSPLAQHCAELTDAAAALGVDARVFVARKANKAVGLVHAARAAGLGLDVASYGELAQAVRAGIAGEDLIVSAAVKSQALIDLAGEHDVAVSVDNLDELHHLLGRADVRGRPARVALRLAVVHEQIAPTRFGLPGAEWERIVTDLPEGAPLAIEGVHVHLNGYAASDRAIALEQACQLVDAMRARGHQVRYVDIGGGVPMSYLESEQEWRDFWQALAAQEGSDVTWRGDRLGLVDPEAERPSPAVYPFWQAGVRGPWLRALLSTRVGSGAGQTVADLLRSRDLALHLEPGRAVLDGCGLTLAEVAFRKATSDGVPLVGLHMNRTQVRSTSADFLVDPLWLRPSGAGDPSDPHSGFLVGAYCIEEEIVMRRRLHFPDGVAVGDIALFPNTAGYLMHIVESASHQLPLARNLIRSTDPADPAEPWSLDEIDHPISSSPPASSPGNRNEGER